VVDETGSEIMENASHAQPYMAETKTITNNRYPLVIIAYLYLMKRDNSCNKQSSTRGQKFWARFQNCFNEIFYFENGYVDSLIK
jgi:hypothetical protein